MSTTTSFQKRVVFRKPRLIASCGDATGFRAFSPCFGPLRAESALLLTRLMERPSVFCLSCSLKCSRNEFVYRSFCVVTLAQFITVTHLNMFKLALVLSLQLEVTFTVHLTVIQHEISYFLKGTVNPSLKHVWDFFTRAYVVPNHYAFSSVKPVLLLIIKLKLKKLKVFFNWKLK